MKTLAIAVLCIVGCGGIERATEEESAIADVWREVYGVAGGVPKIRWISGESLNCGGGYGYLDKGSCWNGQYIATDRGIGDTILVARPEGMALSQTSLSHEMAHAAQWRLKREEDPSHVGPWFAPEGPINAAKAFLMATGH